MTDLSPVAQAVLDAWSDYTMYTRDEEPQALAAALRAAALHLNNTSPWPGHIESTGVNWSSNKLLAIANELEAQ